MQRRQGIRAKDSGKCQILEQTREPFNREGKQEQRGCPGVLSGKGWDAVVCAICIWRG